jgi:hypothetical protein
MIQLSTTLTPRWPLYIAEIVFYSIAFTLSVILRTKRKTGWHEIAILWPWIMMSIGYSTYMVLAAYHAHGDPAPSALLAWWYHTVYVCGGISLSLFLGARIIWKRGS